MNHTEAAESWNRILRQAADALDPLTVVRVVVRDQKSHHFTKRDAQRAGRDHRGKRVKPPVKDFRFFDGHTAACEASPASLRAEIAAMGREARSWASLRRSVHPDTLRAWETVCEGLRGSEAALWLPHAAKGLSALRSEAKCRTGLFTRS